ncbi:MAG: PilZ domain-containing protein [Nitrospirota bacterium]
MYCVSVEKRSCKRKIKRLNINFSDGKEENIGISSDFSCNGLFIRTRKGFREGTVLYMNLELDNGKKLPLTGIVKRTIKTQISNYKNGMGIELTSVHEEYDNFVKELYKA